MSTSISAVNAFQAQLITLNLINKKTGQAKVKSQAEADKLRDMWRDRASKFSFEGMGVTVDMVIIHTSAKEKTCIPFILTEQQQFLKGYSHV